MISTVLLLLAQGQGVSPAQKLFDDVRAKVAAAHSLSLRTHLSMTQNGALPQTADVDVIAEKPNLFRLNLTQDGHQVGTYLCDGTNLYSVFGEKTYGKTTPETQIFIFEMGPGLSAFFPISGVTWSVIGDQPE